MNRIILNLKLLWKKYKKWFSVIAGILSFVLLFFDKKDLGINDVSGGIIYAIAALVIPLIIAVVYVLLYKKIKINDEDPTITAQYGDIWKIAFSKKSSEKKIVVINVNTTFDVIVDEDTSHVEKPLVSSNTLHGQWIKKMVEKGKQPEELLESIKANLHLNGYKPVKSISREEKQCGELDCYERGTIAIYEYENTVFYLVAFSEFDENNVSHNSKSEMIKTIKKIIEFYDKHGQGYSIYIPLLGTGRSRTGISKKESFETMHLMLSLCADKLHGDATIVVYEKDRNVLSLDWE